MERRCLALQGEAWRGRVMWGKAMARHGFILTAIEVVKLSDFPGRCLARHGEALLCSAMQRQGTVLLTSTESIFVIWWRGGAVPGAARLGKAHTRQGKGFTFNRTAFVRHNRRSVS